MKFVADLVSKPEGIAILSALIGALAALSAQIVAGGINLARDLILESVRVKRRAKLAALYCAAELELFITQCSIVSQSQGLEIDPNDVMNARFSDPCPTLPLSPKIEWEFLNSDITAWMFWLSGEARSVESKSDPRGQAPPDYGGVDRYRDEACADLSKHAVLVLARLRKHYGIVKPHS